MNDSEIDATRRAWSAEVTALQKMLADVEARLAEAEKALACCACDEEGMRDGPQNYGCPRVPCECGRRALMERLRGRKFERHS